jgi:hypothetical protein
MATEATSIRFYHSAVDGLVVPNGNTDRQKFINNRPLSIRLSSVIVSPFQSFTDTTHGNLIRSSTGTVLPRITPNARLWTLPASVRHTSPRSDLSMNVVNWKTRPLASSQQSSSGIKLSRSESLQVTNTHLTHYRVMQQAKLDARHFCGVESVNENRSLIREVPSFRSPMSMSR